MAIKDLLSKKIDFSSLLKRKGKNSEDIPMSSYDDTKAFIVKLPVVNIMPSIIAEKYANKDLAASYKRLSVFLILAFGAAQLLSYAYGFITDGTINTAKTESISLQKDVSGYLPYKDYLDEIQQKRAAAAQQLTNEVDFAKITSSLNKVASAAKVNIVKVTYTPGACQNVSGTATIPTIGCLNVSGIGGGSGVQALFSKISDLNGFGKSFISDIGGQGGVFNGAINVNKDSYSSKYTELSKTITDLLLEQGIKISPNSKKVAPKTSASAPAVTTQASKVGN